MEVIDQTEQQPLCCCEYVNESGEKTHVLGLCCDCQEVDQLCDRLLKRQQVECDHVSKIIKIINDRLRIPTCFGAGARRLDQLLDLTSVPPVVIVPVWMYIASLNLTSTVLSFVSVPVMVLLYYRSILRKRRTQFFMSWGLSSTFYIYGIFYINMKPHIDVQRFTVVTLFFICTLVAFFASKHGPGVVNKQAGSIAHKKSFRILPARMIQESNVQRRTSSSDSEKDAKLTEHGNERTSGVKNVHMGTVPTNQEAASMNWCNVCQTAKPNRAGHCKICGHCVQRLDHHCVWIDSCVGAGNHRSFLLSAIFFVLGSLYGGHLSILEICSIQVISQLPQCPSVYSNGRTGVLFVSILYTLLATGGVIALLLQQFHLITHNWTYRERKLAARSSSYREILADLDRGCLANWCEFIRLSTTDNQPDRIVYTV